MDPVPVFQDFDSFNRFALARTQALAMEVVPTTLAGCEPAWRVFGKILKGLFDGIMTETFIPREIKRPDGRFFRIAGVNVTKAAGREVSGWSQPMIMGDGDGFVALVHDLATDDVLIRLKAEPGNVGVATEYCANTRVLVCPPIQFSRSNLEHNECALRGERDKDENPIRPIPLAGLVTDGRFTTLDDGSFWERASEDGGRFFEKVNRYGLIEVKRREELDADIEELPEEDRLNFC